MAPVPQTYPKCSVNVNDYSVFNVDLKKREECCFSLFFSS